MRIDDLKRTATIKHRECGSSVQLADFSPELRDAIAEALVAIVSQTGEVAA